MEQQSSFLFQYTRIDNRSDARRYGVLAGWETPFNMISTQYLLGQWALLAEDAWGKTTIITRRGPRTHRSCDANYILLSRQIGKFRASVRTDGFGAGSQPRGRAYTGALLWNMHPRLRAGVEAITQGGDHRYALEFRYRI